MNKYFRGQTSSYTPSWSKGMSGKKDLIINGMKGKTMNPKSIVNYYHYHVVDVSWLTEVKRPRQQSMQLTSKLVREDGKTG